MSNTLLDNEFVKKIRTDLQKIDLSQSRIGLDKLPKVFLCGGPHEFYEKKPIQDTLPIILCYYCKDKNQPAARYNLLKHLEKNDQSLRKQITIADTIHFKKWYIDGEYQNILDLETDIAVASGLIVVILESAGSIAELGSFIMVEKIKKKMLIFIEEKYEGNDSFIWNGIIEHFNNNTQEQVYIREKNDVVGMQRDIKKFLNRKNYTRTFDVKDTEHQVFFIYEMIKAYGALIDEEILVCLNLLNFLIKPTRLKNLLFILEQFEWIKKISKGNKKFYCIPKKKIDQTKFKKCILIKATNKKKLVSWNANYVLRSALAFYNKGENGLHKDRYSIIKNNENS